MLVHNCGVSESLKPIVQVAGTSCAVSSSVCAGGKSVQALVRQFEVLAPRVPHPFARGAVVAGAAAAARMSESEGGDGDGDRARARVSVGESRRTKAD